MDYDEKCVELAQHFLAEHRNDEDYEVQVAQLADAIQETVEVWYATRHSEWIGQ
jgi:hypothetical protein